MFTFDKFLICVFCFFMAGLIAVLAMINNEINNGIKYDVGPFTVTDSKGQVYTGLKNRRVCSSSHVFTGEDGRHYEFSGNFTVVREKGNP